MLPVRLRRASTHNLRGVDLDLPPGQLVALTGPSGSGKSSLALDTLYAEGQRRFVESFSPYARQFLERLERPPVDSLDPIAATVAVDRRAPIKSSRSTLATMTDLEPYLAALFACEALPVCPSCGVIAEAVAPARAAERILSEWQGSRAVVGYPVRVDGPEGMLQLRDSLLKDGYRRLLVQGRVRDLDEIRPSEAVADGAGLSVVVDRVSVTRSDARRLQQAIETAWHRAHGRAELRLSRKTTGAGQVPLALDANDDTEVVPIVQGLACPRCARAFEPARAALFSYNSPLGACGTCRGFGRVIAVDWDKVFPDPSRPLSKGAIRPWSGASSEYERGILAKFCKMRGIPMDVPWGKLREEQRALVVEGEGTWDEGKYPGVRAWFRWLESRTYKMHVRVLLARYREYSPCGACAGARLNGTALSYRVGGKNLKEWHDLSVTDAGTAIAGTTPRGAQGKLVKDAIASRLTYLDRVGLGYLTLDRQARTLSGGEAQRAALTTALGASLTGTLFVLDEPTVGLHAADVPALAGAMADLSRAGNTVLVVEHDETVVRACDRVVELGPGAGKLGGNILFDGTPSELAERRDLPTARAWRRGTETHDGVRKPQGALTIRGARANNLLAIDVRIPLGVVCAITGPSGSGKSTLAEEILYRAVARARGNVDVPRPGPYDALEGATEITRAVLVDQSPLGRTARGNPATYTKAWSRIRALFAAEPAAAQRELTAGHFSFNVGQIAGRGAGAASGRCEACSGEGYETIEMQFLADVALLCPVCRGKRFRPEVLTVKHRGLDVSQVLDLTIDEALGVFDPLDAHDPTLRRTLGPVKQVGLGYLPLGQPLSMLSGGEAQRLKLARALSEDPRGALFVVDEPSAGLHAEDTLHVMCALRTLTDQGASVVVVEHDLDVIRTADWVIDLGPGAGPAGGRVVAEGAPEAIARSGSKTGRALAGTLTTHAPPKAPRAPGGGHVGIGVENAREHNLREVSCIVPHGALTVLTGPSGSGKSSLAFDVIFAEGQRRFMETLTPYARQFLPTLPRPDADRVTGVPPSIALEQRTTRAGVNSTVATVTEIAHYLRLLYAKLGTVRCPDCQEPVSPTTPDELYERLVGMPDRGRTTLFAPTVRARKGTYLDLFTAAARAGVQAARVDGAIVAVDPPPRLTKAKEHTIDLIVYFGALRSLDRATFDRALGWGEGAVRLAPGAPTAQAHAREEVYSTARACPRCGAGVPELDPRWFSFNTKQGQCEACEGTGVHGGPAAVEEGGATSPCRACRGSRLATLPRGVLLGGLTYPELLARSVTDALRTVRGWTFSGRDSIIARAPHAELVRRLAFVDEVGLGYLGLGRAAWTLSGGEMQRLRLSAQLGSGLTGALYVLDEPTIGLHPRDTKALLRNLRALVATGSTVMVVEHDAETIQAADHVIDLGPGGGLRGGHIVAQGPAKRVLSDPKSPTARALREPGGVARPRRGPSDHHIQIVGAREHNLKNVTFDVPLGRMVVVAGVSGSGKSTLVRKIFYPALRKALGLVADPPGDHDAIRSTGRASRKRFDPVRRALAVDQSPIGRTPRSVPATFLGIWDDVRKLFASLPDAKVRGYTPARFSFNTSGGGRCATCEGQGAIVSEMAFLPDVTSFCETCGGARFEPATLDVRYAGLSVGEVLRLTAEEAAKTFAAHPRIARPLQTLCDLGVGYLSIGQGSNTLSGGEAQRLKLAAELTAGSAHEPTVYVLDEPTTGLHLADVRRLVTVLDRLVDRGDTLVIIEHHPDVIASADWVIELGPGAGDDGGKIVFEGEPGKLAKAKTPTGRFFADQAREVSTRSSAGQPTACG